VHLDKLQFPLLLLLWVLLKLMEPCEGKGMLLGLDLDMGMELGEGKLLELDMPILGIGMLC
jgi:hypothetical protein